MTMTITIPVWLLWLAGIPLGLLVLMLAGFGLGVLITFSECFWR